MKNITISSIELLQFNSQCIRL